MSAFAIEIPVGDDEAMGQFQEMMDKLAEETNKYTDEVAEKHDLTFGQASDVVYLRTRSRWTQELEDRLIKELKEGKDCNVFSGKWPEED